MDKKLHGRITDPNEYHGVRFGKDVILYGKVVIKKGTYIGDYSIIGKPTVDHINDKSPLRKTIIDSNVYIGAFCMVHNGARIEQKVTIEEGCNIGWNSTIGANSRIIYGAQIFYNVSIGKKCVIGGFCCDHAKIEEEVIMFGKLVHKFPPKLIRRFSNPISLFSSDLKEKSPVIKRKAVIGFDAIVIGGVKIESDSYIAAKAIVTKDVPSRNIVVGKEYYTYKEWNRKKIKA